MRRAVAIGFAASTILPGCFSLTKIPPREVYLNRDIRRVAVLAPFNETPSVDCWEKMWPDVERLVAARGYQVVPHETLSAFYRSKKYTDPGMITAYAPEELAKEFQADGVLYSNITRWGRKTLGFYSDVGVTAEFLLRDGKTGEEVWRADGNAGKSRVATDLGDVLSNTVGVLLTDMEGYCRSACERAFARMPRPGFEPRALPEGSDAKRPESAPNPSP